MRAKWILCGLLAIAIALGFWLIGEKDHSTALGTSSHELTRAILAYGPRPPASDALEKVKSHLAKELEANGWTTRLQEFERDTPIGKVKFSNLRARMSVESTDTWERKVTGILCAHIDSKAFASKRFLGADDSASACAAIVEMAKYLTSQKPDQARQLELVFFDGEESFAENMTLLDGLYGSRFYANIWRGKDDKPQFGILLDMIGHKNLSIAIPSDSPEKLSEMMFEVAKNRKVSGHFGTAPGPIMDDHLPLNLVGIPTLDIIGDFAKTKWWHTPGDSADIIDPESLSISIGVILEMLDGLLGD